MKTHHRKLEYKLFDEWSRLDAQAARSPKKVASKLRARKSRVGSLLNRIRARS